MINLNDCVEIGQFTRPHGYKGQLILKLNNLSFDEIEEMEWVFVLIDGLPVPFSISGFSERTADSILIKLEDIDSIELAERVKNMLVFVNKKALKKGTESKSGFSQLTGYKVVDKSSGFLGILDSTIEDTINPLLRILDGKQEILLPLQDEFIVDVNNNTKEILVICPPGLLDIF